MELVPNVKIIRYSPYSTTCIPYKVLKFSGGEIQVRIDYISNISRPPLNDKDSISLVTNITSSDVFMEMLLLTDALRRLGWTKISLTSKYFPYARQDRVCYPGESLSLKVVCDIINAQNYEKVAIWDAHSDVTPALLNNVENVHCSNFVKWIHLDTKTLLVAPDAGSVKKISVVSKNLNFPMIVAEKVRDSDTGEITGTKCIIPEEYLDYDILIVDDICDGGRTFVELSKVLSIQSTKQHLLYVTHGIFSNGFDILGEWFDCIYTANSFLPELPEFVKLV